MRGATRRQGRTVRQSEKGHDRKGMRREERLQAKKVGELKEQSVHPESAMSGDEGKRADTTAKLERAVGKGLTDRDGEKGIGTVTGKP